jgi:hypothetical protein
MLTYTVCGHHAVRQICAALKRDAGAVMPAALGFESTCVGSPIYTGAHAEPIGFSTSKGPGNRNGLSPCPLYGTGGTDRMSVGISQHG